jgi:hypothetical protein
MKPDYFNCDGGPKLLLQLSAKPLFKRVFANCKLCYVKLNYIAHKHFARFLPSNFLLKHNSIMAVA